MKFEQAAVAVALRSVVGVGVLVAGTVPVAVDVVVGVPVICGGRVISGREVSVGVSTGHLGSFMQEKVQYPKVSDTTMSRRMITTRIRMIRFSERTSSLGLSLVVR